MYLLLCVTLLSIRDALSEPPLAVVKEGTLRGTFMKTLGGKEIAAFLGVPYAAPPVRFQAPSPPRTWEGILDATKPKSDCLQYTELGLYVHGSEDCLYAYVYAPKDYNETKTLKDVIIYIHGGGFSCMLGHYGPKYLLDHDVVYVFFTYRLGPLGFLSTGDTVIPGNFGLKDQNMLLQWVSRNIEAFGGNSKSVTLTGTSAGGASVHYHMLSPMSKGLIHRAFSMSGTVLDPWTKTENFKERASKLAELLSCPSANSSEIHDCLLKKEGREIVSKMKDFQTWIYYPFTVFGPVVEANHPSAFISKSPIEIIKNKEAQEVPWLTTLTTEEGLYPVADFIANETLLKYLDNHWNEVAPSLLDYGHLFEGDALNEISRNIRKRYFGYGSISKNEKALIDVCSDRHFVLGTLEAAELHSSNYKSPVYSYIFSYRGKNSVSGYVSKSNKNWGVCHADDTGYMFENEMINTAETENDRKMIAFMTKMLVNFAKTGVPQLDDGLVWPNVNDVNDSFTYVNIKDPAFNILERNFAFDKCHFWDSLNLKEKERY
ncbi:venom carboxylesterase-6 [Halyomorpha halys]|uniref:venom carboxylesterase-6 n=1 Tax=Halyomorpha halys TaxID=286706 RepID=UPI0006D518AC|nr:venom carboxylesterase-6-like [Halyomorpha halys]